MALTSFWNSTTVSAESKSSSDWGYLMDGVSDTLSIREGGGALRKWLTKTLEPLIQTNQASYYVVKIISQLGPDAGETITCDRSSYFFKQTVRYENIQQHCLEVIRTYSEPNDFGRIIESVEATLKKCQLEDYICIAHSINIGGTLDIGAIVTIAPKAIRDPVDQMCRLLSSLVAASINSEKMSLGVETLSRPFWREESTEKEAARYIVKGIQETIRCACAVVWLVDKEQRFLETRAVAGNVSATSQFTMPVGVGIAGTCQERGNILFISDLLNTNELNSLGITGVAHPEVVRKSDWRSAIFVPLDAGGQSLGVVAAYGTRARSFSMQERDIVVAFCQRFTAAIVHARRHAELSRLNDKLRKHAPAIEAGLMAIKHVHDVNNLLYQTQNKLNEIRERASVQVSPAIHIRAKEAAMFLDQSSRILRKMVRAAAAPNSLHPSRVDLKEFLSELISPFQSSESRRGIIIELDCPDSLSVRFDRHQIEQAISNIVENAVSFLAEDRKPGIKTVSVRVVDKGDEIDIEIRDSGPGFQEGAEEHLFNPFYTTRPGRGLGFGLWIAQNALEAHQGRITASSKWGYWSKFVIHLPKFGNMRKAANG